MDTDSGNFTVVERQRLGQHHGYTPAEIPAIFQDADRSRSRCSRVREILHRRIVENCRRRVQLTVLQNRMRVAIEAWNDWTDEHGLCSLIESTRTK